MGLLPGCLFGGDGGQGGADELAELANKVSEATFAAVYQYAVTGSTATGVATKMEIAQTPLASLRKLETTTKRQDGEDDRHLGAG